MDVSLLSFFLVGVVGGYYLAKIMKEVQQARDKKKLDK